MIYRKALACLLSCNISCQMKMSASDSYPPARKPVKYFKRPTRRAIFVKDAWTIKDDLCKFYSYFMHDKHHYLDNYCSHESDADGNAWNRENLNLLEEKVFFKCVSTLFYWDLSLSGSLWRHSFHKPETERILMKMIHFARCAENETL